MSKENDHLDDGEREFHFKDMDQVIVRNEDSVWAPAFFRRLETEFHEGRPFSTYENYYAFVAVLGGNESKIGTQDDAYELYDMERLIESGYING